MYVFGSKWHDQLFNRCSTHRAEAKANLICASLAQTTMFTRKQDDLLLVLCADYA